MAAERGDGDGMSNLAAVLRHKAPMVLPAAEREGNLTWETNTCATQCGHHALINLICTHPKIAISHPRTKRPNAAHVVLKKSDADNHSTEAFIWAARSSAKGHTKGA